jgi:hypothetical protein
MTDPEVVPPTAGHANDPATWADQRPSSDSMPLRKRLASVLLGLVIDWRKA